MGKALIVAGVIVIVASIGAGLLMYFRQTAHKEKAADRGWAIKGDLNKHDEQRMINQLISAAQLLRYLATPPAELNRLEEVNFLTADGRARVEQWLRDYNQMAKEITK